MKLIFKSLDIENFMSIGKVHIDFTAQKGYNIVSGINKCMEDNAKSNGSGKSSLWEAISWVLTGTTVRGSKDIVNINADDGAVVSIVFESDNHEYFLQRSKDHSKLKTNLKIIIDGKDESGKGIRDSEQILKKRLPDLTSSLIGSVIILGQGLPQRFTNNTPSGRKEVLETLAQSDFMITDLKNRLSSRKDELSKKLRESEDAILKLTSENAIFERTIKENQEKIENLPDVNMVLEKLDEYNNEKEQLEIQISEEQESLSEQTALLDKVNSEYINILNEKHAQLKVVENSYIEEMSKLSDQLTPLETEISVIKSEIKKIDSITDVCPTCGQKIPNINKPDSTPLKEKLDVKLAEASKLKTLIQDIKQKTFIDQKAIEDKYEDDLTHIESNKNTIKNNVSQKESLITAKLERRTFLINSISNCQNQIANRDNLKSMLESSIEENTGKIKENREKILYINIQKDDVTQRLSVVNKMYSYATRDFRGYLLSNVINYINSKAKEYCKDVFSTELLDFELSGNNILISYNKRDYENLSGGERQKIDLIVQFAIRDMLCKFLNFSSNIIILDELFDNLDSFGCQKILDLISSKLTEVENIYIVTHHSDISIPYDNEIVVEKGVNGISRII